MTTDLIKTLEGLEKKVCWNNMERQFYRCSLPQIISALKDAERMREGLRFASGDTENKLCYVCGKNHYGEWKYDCPIYKASTPTADTKESKPHA